jgi:hypothetical protein
MRSPRRTTNRSGSWGSPSTHRARPAGPATLDTHGPDHANGLALHDHQTTTPTPPRFVPLLTSPTKRWRAAGGTNVQKRRSRRRTGLDAQNGHRTHLGHGGAGVAMCPGGVGPSIEGPGPVWLRALDPPMFFRKVLNYDFLVFLGFLAMGQRGSSPPGWSAIPTQACSWRLSASHELGPRFRPRSHPGPCALGFERCTRQGLGASGARAGSTPAMCSGVGG